MSCVEKTRNVGPSDLFLGAILVPYLDLLDDHFWFGHAVAIDGDLMVVGAPRPDFHLPRSGAAYVFMSIDGDWHIQAKLVPSDGEVDHGFGFISVFSLDLRRSESNSETRITSRTDTGRTVKTT